MLVLLIVHMISSLLPFGFELAVGHSLRLGLY